MRREIPDLAARWEAASRQFPDNFQGVAVGYSGGPDSTALFHLLRGLGEAPKNLRLALAHVHYGLRGQESDEDFRFAEALARSHGVAFFPRLVSPEERAARRGEGLQEWARRLRQEHFAQLAREGWVIALAHHLDDQAETVLFRLARGAGPGALLGMREWSPPYWRPLLGVPKADLVAYLAAEGHPYRNDASNDKMDYARNVIRHQILPTLDSLFAGAAGRIVACAQEAADLNAWCLATLATQSHPSTPDNSSPLAPLQPEPVRPTDPGRLHQPETPLAQATRSLTLPTEDLAIAHPPQNPASPTAPGPAARPRTSWRREELAALPEGVARAALAAAMGPRGDGRPRQLSRRLLAATLTRLRHPSAHQDLGRWDLPGGGRLEVRGGEVRTRAASHPPQAKPPRQAQHQRGLEGGPGLAALVEPQAYVSFRRGSSQSGLGMVPEVGSPVLSPARLRVYGAAAGKSICFKCSNQTWKLKNLFSTWRVPLSERARWRIVEQNGEVMGLSDGRTLAYPGQADDNTECSQTGFDLRDLETRIDESDAFP